MLYAAAALIIIGAVVFTLYVREQDLPVVAAPPPYQYLEDRKAQIYENLRDLQFEYRVGKLSDADYQKTKLELQTELARTLSELDRQSGKAAPAAAAATAAPVVQVEPAAVAAYVCPHCKAGFDRPLKFCGECGKAMTGDAA